MKPEPPAVSMHETAAAPDNDALREIQNSLEDLTERIERMEASIGRLYRRERDVPDYTDEIRHLSSDLNAEAGKLRRINGQVEKVIDGLKGTPGYTSAGISPVFMRRARAVASAGEMRLVRERGLVGMVPGRVALGYSGRIDGRNCRYEKYKMKYRILLTRLALALLLVFTFVSMMPVSPAAAYGQYIYVTPNHGPSGTRINVEGVSFTPSVYSGDDAVPDTTTFAKIYFPDKNTLVKTRQAISGINTYFTVSEHPAGSYRVWVYDESAPTPVWTSTTFTLEPRIDISRSSGFVGDNITVSGSGFAASANTTIYYDDVLIACATANTTGSFNNASMIIPAGPSSQHTIRAIDSNNNTAFCAFVSRPDINLTPASGSVGDEIVIGGTGFSRDGNNRNSITSCSQSFFGNDRFGRDFYLQDAHTVLRREPICVGSR